MEKHDVIRVLHVVGSLNSGGTENFIMNLYRMIDRKTVQFDFVCPVGSGTFVNEITKLGGRIFYSPKFTGHNIIVYKSWWKEFYKKNKEYKIVHGHLRTGAFIYLAEAKNNHIKTIAHSHSISNGKGLSALYKSIVQYPIRFLADYKFACTINAGKWLFGENAPNRSDFFIIRNAINIERFRYNEESRTRVRNTYNIEDNVYLLGSVGNFTIPKNHKYIIYIFSKIHDMNKMTKLMLVGTGPLENEIRKMVDEYDLTDSVVFTGSVSNPQDYYNAIDCFMFPSLWEGLGMAAVEAQVSGLRVIASDNVPHDIAITKECTFIPIMDEQGWINYCSQKNYKRIDNSEAIKAAGYDVKEVSKWLETFYLNETT